MNEVVPQSVIGVKEFVGILNETLNFAFPLVTVEGEVHSFKVNQQKWVFFDLKDDEATLSCFMPVYALKVALEDGMKIRATGSPKLTKWGKFSFTVKVVELAGEGELRRAYELLKGRLEGEGMFDDARKRSLPRYPASIGLVASTGSAAYADFMKILEARWGGLTIEVADVQVQGAPAPAQIMGAIGYFNQLAHPVDVVVLIRGGGSLEDLQAFNTEDVTRAVASSRTPIVVGVGHEVDLTLADFAADVRAATPTDAARLVVPDRFQVGQVLDYQCLALERGIEQSLVSKSNKIDHHIGMMVQFLAGPREVLAIQTGALKREFYRIHLRMEGYAQTLQYLSGLLVGRQREGFKSNKVKLQALSRLLEGFSPQANLARGYSIVRLEGIIIKSVSQVSAGDELMLQLADGHISAQMKRDEEEL